VKNLFYKAHMIVYPIDIRWFFDSEEAGDGEVPFKACLVGPRRVRVRVPSLSYSLLHDREETNPAVGAAGALTMDDVRHKISGDSERKWTMYELIFPDDHTLGSSVIYSEAGNYEELDVKLMPVEMKHKKMDTLSEESYMVACVARTDTGTRTMGPVEKKTKKSKTSALLSKHRGRAKSSDGAT